MARVFIDEDFSDGMDNGWVEGNRRVWIGDGRLHVHADRPEDSDDPFVAKVWCHTPRHRGHSRPGADSHPALPGLRVAG